jgi:DNA-binding MarR family transcriptional regulator
MTTTDVAVLQAIADHNSPAVGTADIASAVDVSRQAADRRLRGLQDDELVGKYHAGQSVVWYLTDAGRRYLEDIG